MDSPQLLIPGPPGVQLGGADKLPASPPLSALPSRATPASACIAASLLASARGAAGGEAHGRPQVTSRQSHATDTVPPLATPALPLGELPLLVTCPPQPTASIATHRPHRSTPRTGQLLSENGTAIQQYVTEATSACSSFCERNLRSPQSRPGSGSGRRRQDTPPAISTASSAESLLKALGAELGVGPAIEILEGERARVRAAIAGDHTYNGGREPEGSLFVTDSWSSENRYRVGGTPGCWRCGSGAASPTRRC
jgi:hypothetical protein